MTSKNVDLQKYLKPMISKPGILASMRNRYIMGSFVSNKKGENSSLISCLKVPKLLKVEVKKKKRSENSESPSFKTVSRKKEKNSDSPPPGRYSPKFEYLQKKSPIFSFSKEAKRINSVGSSPLHSLTPELPKLPQSLGKIHGVPFEKQLKRKTLYSNENPHEKRFESNAGNSLLQASKIHSFSSYVARKPFYRVLEFMPDYSPKYDSVSRVYKKNFE